MTPGDCWARMATPPVEAGTAREMVQELRAHLRFCAPVYGEVQLPMTTKEHVSTFQTFQVRPQLLEMGKTTTMLTRTDLASASVQVIASGGETNLHAHSAEDGVWLVLGGKARFYTTNDQEVATLGPFEGLTIPRGTPYWFESGSEENLVILRFSAKSLRDPDDRINLATRKFSVDGQQPAQRPTRVREGQFFGTEKR